MGGWWGVGGGWGVGVGGGCVICPGFWITELAKQRGLRYGFQVPRNGFLENEPNIRIEVEMLDPGQHP